MRYRSKKREAEYKIRRPMVASVQGQACEVQSEVCTGRATTLHEKRKRSSNGSIINPANLVAICDRCNSWAECEPLKARRAGWVVREGDPEWEFLGRKNDRNIA